MPREERCLTDSKTISIGKWDIAETIPTATVRALDRNGHYFYDGLPELVDDIKNLEVFR